MMKRFTLQRRAVLKGLAGAAVSLPLLELMLDAAPARAQVPPKRYIVTFGGLSTGDPRLIVPSTVGRDYDVKRSLGPLATLGNIKNEVSVVSGLRLPQDGPGGWTGRWHSSSVGPLICGVS